jgi:uncharacterized phage protein (TIGR02220 family)
MLEHHIDIAVCAEADLHTLAHAVVLGQIREWHQHQINLLVMDAYRQQKAHKKLKVDHDKLRMIVSPEYLQTRIQFAITLEQIKDILSDFAKVKLCTIYDMPVYSILFNVKTYNSLTKKVVFFPGHQNQNLHTLSNYIIYNYNYNTSTTYHTNVYSLLCVSEKNLEKPTRKKDYTPQVKEILDYFKTVTGSSRTVKSNLPVIGPRLKDGYSVDECKLVILDKYLEWICTPQEKYIRPSTLFQKSKFDEYLSAAKDSGRALEDYKRNIFSSRDEPKHRAVQAVYDHWKKEKAAHWGSFLRRIIHSPVSNAQWEDLYETVGADNIREIAPIVARMAHSGKVENVIESIIFIHNKKLANDPR